MDELTLPSNVATLGKTNLTRRRADKFKGTLGTSSASPSGSKKRKSNDGEPVALVGDTSNGDVSAVGEFPPTYTAATHGNKEESQISQLKGPIESQKAKNTMLRKEKDEKDRESKGTIARLSDTITDMTNKAEIREEVIQQQQADIAQKEALLDHKEKVLGHLASSESFARYLLRSNNDVTQSLVATANLKAEEKVAVTKREAARKVNEALEEKSRASALKDTRGEDVQNLIDASFDKNAKLKYIASLLDANPEAKKQVEQLAFESLFETFCVISRFDEELKEKYEDLD